MITPLSKPKVIYWNNYPSPYMVDRWNAVAADGRIDLEVWLTSESASDRSWEFDESDWKFRYFYVPSVGIGSRRLPVPIRIIITRPDVLVSHYDKPWNLAGWGVAKTAPHRGTSSQPRRGAHESDLYAGELHLR